jgi:hypothetical protein
LTDNRSFLSHRSRLTRHSYDEWRNGDVTAETEVAEHRGDTSLSGGVTKPETGNAVAIVVLAAALAPMTRLAGSRVAPTAVRIPLQ